jgi:probable HAF family extracellular repeat protein
VGRAPETRAFFWSSAGTQDLGALAGDLESEAVNLNDAGEIVGWSRGSAGTRAVLWRTGGAMLDLGSLRGANHNRARAINNRSEVVGDSGNKHDSRAFLWTSAGGMQDLNAFVPATAGVVLLEAVAINDHGVIAALGRDHDHSTHDHQRHGRAAPVRVFLLTPAR